MGLQRPFVSLEHGRLRASPHGLTGATSWHPCGYPLGCIVGDCPRTSPRRLAFVRSLRADVLAFAHRPVPVRHTSSWALLESLVNPCFSGIPVMPTHVLVQTVLNQTSCYREARYAAEMSCSLAHLAIDANLDISFCFFLAEIDFPERHPDEVAIRAAKAFQACC